MARYIACADKNKSIIKVYTISKEVIDKFELVKYMLGFIKLL